MHATKLGLLVAAMTVPLSAAWATPKSAVEKRYSAAYNSCMNSGDAAHGVTSGIMDCNGAEIDLQDARLNQAYKMVMSRLDDQQKTVLRTSERNWIKSRDAACKKSVGDEEGGTLGTVMYSNCILDETISRTIYLENHR